MARRPAQPWRVEPLDASEAPVAVLFVGRRAEARARFDEVRQERPGDRIALVHGARLVEVVGR